jgi:hypothetical protein
MSDLSDDIIKDIAGGLTDRCYLYEGKAMAQEILRRRNAEKAAATAPTNPPGLPYPFHP